MHIGMIEHCLEANHNDVDIHDGLVKAQDIQGAQHAYACANQFKYVLARTCQPVHGFGRMMDSMEAP